MSAPRRIQRQRTRGWRMPEGAVYVGRPSRWGNPHRVGDPLLVVGDLRVQRLPRGADAADVVWAYREALQRDLLRFWRDDVHRELRGRDLVCWCPLDQPCHADVLLEVANEVQPSTVAVPDNVVELRRPTAYDGLTCDVCGDAWFQAAVTIAHDGRVTGRTASVECVECGHRQVLA